MFPVGAPPGPPFSCLDGGGVAGMFPVGAPPGPPFSCLDGSGAAGMFPAGALGAAGMFPVCRYQMTPTAVIRPHVHTRSERYHSANIAKIKKYTYVSTSYIVTIQNL